MVEPTARRSTGSPRRLRPRPTAAAVRRSALARDRLPRGPIPASARWSEPRIDTTTRDSAAERVEAGVEARVYGEDSTSGIREGRVPVLVADAAIDPGARFQQALPASYNGFVYVLAGAVRAAGGTELRAGQVGWLDRPDSAGTSVLRLEGSEGERARIVLYAGEPQHRPIVTHGPFVGETRADLMRVSRDYMEGRFPRVSALTRESRSAAHEP